MAKRLWVMLLGTSLLLLPFMPVYAQAPPSAIDDALADLSSRAGRTLTLDDLTSWNWTQSTYPSTALGCPQSGQDYATVETDGYRILFVYNGATFDYRAPVAGGTVFLCSGPATIPQASTTTTTEPETAPADSTGSSVCEGAMDTRLRTGIQARVLAGGLPNNIRSEPTTASQRIGQLPPGEPFSIIGGPECAQNLVWWQITYGDVTGWTAEGQAGSYWLEPVSGTDAPTAAPADDAATTAPAATPQVFNTATDGQALTLANASLLARIAELPVSEQITGLAWSQDGTTLAATVPTGIWLYNAQAFTQPPRLLRVPDAAVNDIAASPNQTLLATAHADATVRIWDTSTGGQRAVLRDHAQPVLAVAFSPDGTLLATGGGSLETGEDSVIRLWDSASGNLIAQLPGHTAAITSLAFSPDGTLLASASLDNSVRLWDVINATPGTVLSNHTAPVYAVAFSPHGSLVASAGDDTTVQLWDIASGTSTILEGHTAPVRVLLFSPDGSLLISAGGPDDNSLRMWNIATAEPVPPLDSYGGAPEAIVQAMGLSPDGTILAFATFEQPGSVIRLWGPAPP